MLIHKPNIASLEAFFSRNQELFHTVIQVELEYGHYWPNRKKVFDCSTFCSLSRRFTHASQRFNRLGVLARNIENDTSRSRSNNV